MFQKKFMERVYEKATKPSDLLWHSEEPSKFLVEAIRERKQSGTALDLGCGAGVFSIYLAKSGYQVTGLDFIHKALEMASQLAKEKGALVNWVQADLLNWNSEKKFDIILDSGCLHTISDKEKFKENVVNWLAPGGDFILGHFGRRNFWDWRPVGPIRRSKDELEKLFRPELKLRAYDARVLAGVPLPIGPTVQLQSLWFTKK
ncbi:MAG TPA: class I SAM-dependent methyltransferase [Chryseolinea sp.]|nr:class I SAM-dependent methyltransferase [Chryseolinea sp.]